MTPIVPELTEAVCYQVLFANWHVNPTPHFMRVGRAEQRRLLPDEIGADTGAMFLALSAKSRATPMATKLKEAL